jgi:hypothetical protein
MKVSFTRARARVRGEWYEEGSVLKGTARSVCTGLFVDLSIESSEGPDRIAKLAENAESLCYAEQAIMAPVPVGLSVTLNGEPLPCAGADASGEASNA